MKRILCTVIMSVVATLCLSLVTHDKSSFAQVAAEKSATTTTAKSVAAIQQPKQNAAALPAVPKVNKLIAEPSAATIPGTAKKKFSIEGAIYVNPKEAEPFQPIVAGCQCVIPKDADTEIKLSWVLDEHCKGIQSADGREMYLWSPPGEHEISVLVESKLFETTIVLVHDPKYPGDITKIIEKKLRILVDMSRETYTAHFAVIEPVPPVPPVPLVPPPTPELQSAVIGIQSVMAAADKSKAAIFANAWSDFAIALKAGTPLKTNSEYRNAITQFLNAAIAKANLTGAFPGFSAQLEAALTKIFTNVDGKLDNAKAIDFANAIVWACKR